MRAFKKIDYLEREKRELERAKVNILILKFKLNETPKEDPSVI
jgi:hypothetical protein